eukprot:2213936-Heterocapsa_arctica.AAC.1
MVHVHGGGALRVVHLERCFVRHAVVVERAAVLEHHAVEHQLDVGVARGLGLHQGDGGGGGVGQVQFRDEVTGDGVHDP